jgi:hypothetical protein
LDGTRRLDPSAPVRLHDNPAANQRDAADGYVHETAQGAARVRYELGNN